MTGSTPAPHEVIARDDGARALARLRWSDVDGLGVVDAIELPGATPDQGLAAREVLTLARDGVRRAGLAGLRVPPQCLAALSQEARAAVVAAASRLGMTDGATGLDLDLRSRWCERCGRDLNDPAGHLACERARDLEPPRYCALCRRRMTVQVVPTGWSARCVEHGVLRST